MFIPKFLATCATCCCNKDNKSSTKPLCLTFLLRVVYNRTVKETSPLIHIMLWCVFWHAWLFVCRVQDIHSSTADASESIKLCLLTHSDHFAKIIEPLRCLSFKLVSALVMDDKALMHSSPFAHLHCAGSLLTYRLKINILCFHFVWSSENKNIQNQSRHQNNVVSEFR